MTKTSAIATRKKKPPTPAERLHALDPDLAALFDTWEADLNRDYDSAYTQNADPPLLDAEETLAFELGRLSLAAEPILDIADGLRAARDEAAMTLGRLEQEIAKRYVEALRITHQPALPPPDRHIDDEDQTLRIIHQAAVEVLEDADPDPTEIGPDGLPVGTPPWDDPEGAHIVTERPRASSGCGPKWWARITTVAAAGATLLTSVVLAGWTLFEQARP